MIIDPRSLSTNELYHLMTSCVVPRPIAFVTSVGAEGIVNAAPFSYFNAISSTPPTIMISVSRRDGVMKDTARNIHRSREFVVNIVDEQLAEQMNVTSATLPPDVSEIEAAQLSLLPSIRVKTPRIAESPIHLECVLSQWIEIGDKATDLILGEIVHIHVSDEVWEEGRINLRKLQALGRLSGSDYCRTTDILSMKRPTSSGS